MADSLPRRVRLGALLGSAIGVAFAVVVVPVMLARGEAFLTRTQTRLDVLALTYLVGGALSGVLTAALLPLARRHIVGAALVGMVAIAPLYLGGRLAVRGLQTWDLSDTVVIGACCILVGGLTGALVFSALRTRTDVHDLDLPPNGR